MIIILSIIAITIICCKGTTIYVDMQVFVCFSCEKSVSSYRRLFLRLLVVPVFEVLVEGAPVAGICPLPELVGHDLEVHSDMAS